MSADAGSIMAENRASIASIKMIDSDQLPLMAKIQKLPETRVLAESLAPGFFLRQSGADMAHVQLLADAWSSTRLPPIVVQLDGLRIIDGMHRLAAAKLRLETHIRARVIDCTNEEAFILAVQLNTLHGLPLSKADRVAGAKRILSTHPDWSDRAVAEVAGLSAKTVGVLRNRSSGDVSSLTKRLGRDGKKHPVNGAEGRSRAVEYIKTHPGAPLRQIAKETGVSLGTAHDVRERLRCGENPLINRVGAGRRESAAASALDTAQIGLSSPAAASALTESAQPRRNADEGIAARPARRDAMAKNNAQQAAWSAMSDKLARDPALRYSEGGRAFLRWMSLHAAQPEDWREFIDAIPGHWLGDVELMAKRISEEWHLFAEGLSGRQHLTDGAPWLTRRRDRRTVRTFAA